MFKFEWSTSLPVALDESKVLCIDDGRAEAQCSYLVLSDNTQVLKCFGFRVSTTFKDATTWSDQIVIGYGDRAFAYFPDRDSLKKLPLDPQTGFDYFGSFYLDADKNFLLIATGTSLFKFDTEFSLIWKAADLGVDGVTVEEVADDVIYGNGEWDPPNGWRPYQVDLKTGVILPRKTVR